MQKGRDSRLGLSFSLSVLQTVNESQNRGDDKTEIYKGGALNDVVK